MAAVECPGVTQKRLFCPTPTSMEFPFNCGPFKCAFTLAVCLNSTGFPTGRLIKRDTWRFLCLKRKQYFIYNKI